MGRLFALHYDQTPDSRFLLCKTCHTHISLVQFVEVPAHLSPIIRLPKNVVVDTPEHHHKHDRFGFGMEVADVHCVGCNMLLGMKITHAESILNTVIEGGVLLEVKNLLYWNGEMMIDAPASFPAPDDA